MRIAIAAILGGIVMFLWGAVAHTMLLEYISFIILLFALFTISGGIVVEGNLHGSPWLNTRLLALGAVLASVMGTTGAAMLLIRHAEKGRYKEDSKISVVRKAIRRIKSALINK